MLVGGAQINVDLTFLDHAFTGNVSAGSHNFSMNCGAGGDVILGAQIASTGVFGTVTIGGVTATQRTTVVSGGGFRTAIYTATGVPSGTQTVAIAVSGGSGVSTRWGAQLYSIKHQASLVPVSTATDNAHQTGTPAATLNVPIGGAAIGTAIDSGTSTTATWTGLTTDASDNSGVSTVYSSGSTELPSGNASLSVSVAFTGGTIAGAVACWAVWST